MFSSETLPNTTFSSNAFWAIGDFALHFYLDLAPVNKKTSLEKEMFGSADVSRENRFWNFENFVLFHVTVHMCNVVGN